MLVVAKEDLERDTLFMVQKFFEMAELNVRKFMKIVEGFTPFLVDFTRQLQKVNPDHVISITDMIKQTLAKLLKCPRDEGWHRSEHLFFVMFQGIAENSTREVN